MWQIDGRVVYQTADLLLLELVGAEDLETLRALAGGQPLAGAFQLLEHLLDGDVLLQTQTPSTDALPKFFQDSPSHQIFEHIHEVLNRV